MLFPLDWAESINGALDEKVRWTAASRRAMCKVRGVKKSNEP